MRIFDIICVFLKSYLLLPDWLTRLVSRQLEIKNNSLQPRNFYDGETEIWKNRENFDEHNQIYNLYFNIGRTQNQQITQLGWQSGK